jgi:hypothetical protein
MRRAVLVCLAVLLATGAAAARISELPDRRDGRARRRHPWDRIREEGKIAVSRGGEDSCLNSAWRPSTKSRSRLLFDRNLFPDDSRQWHFSAVFVDHDSVGVLLGIRPRSFRPLFAPLIRGKESRMEPLRSAEIQSRSFKGPADVAPAGPFELQLAISAMACLARAAISSGGTSSTCVAIDQEWPNGS